MSCHSVIHAINSNSRGQELSIIHRKFLKVRNPYHPKRTLRPPHQRSPTPGGHTHQRPPPRSPLPVITLPCTTSRTARLHPSPRIIITSPRGNVLPQPRAPTPFALTTAHGLHCLLLPRVPSTPRKRPSHRSACLIFGASVTCAVLPRTCARPRQLSPRRGTNTAHPPGRGFRPAVSEEFKRRRFRTVEAAPWGLFYS